MRVAVDMIPLPRPGTEETLQPEPSGLTSGTLRRLAKNGLIDKDKVGDIIEKKRKNKKCSSSSSYSDSSSDSDSDSNSSSESSSPSSDGKKKKSKKQK